MAFPEPRYKNSAGRLLAILNAIPNGQAYLQVIPPLFNSEARDGYAQQQACMSGLSELHKLFQEFISDLEAATTNNEQQKKVMVLGLESIKSSIYPIQLNGGFRALTESEKALLEVAATMIPEEDAVTEDDIARIRQSIADLRSIVEEADVSPSLRKVLLDLIRMSEDAISRVNVYGARGLRRAFKSMLAEAMEAYASAPAKDELSKSPTWSKVVRHLQLFDEVASRLAKYQPLLQTVTQYLLGGPPA